eukprot:2907439-Prymnesium_polylepis.2
MEHYSPSFDGTEQNSVPDELGKRAEASDFASSLDSSGSKLFLGSGSSPGCALLPATPSR